MRDSEEVARFEVYTSDEGKDLPPGGTSCSSTEIKSGWGSRWTRQCPVGAGPGGKRSVAERNYTPDKAETVF